MNIDVFFKRRLSLLFCFLLFVFSSVAKADLMLLQTYDQKQNVSGWVMSEKLDGVRAFWNGKKLLSKGGHQIMAPTWFVKDFPPFALDGELWTKRQDFENVVSIVRRHNPDSRWKQVSFQVFDVPHAKGGLKTRLHELTRYLRNHAIPHLQVIPHIEVKDNAHLQKVLQNKLALGAEGLVVRNPDKPYSGGRSSFDLKVKPFFESECRIVNYQSGKGKYEGLVGAIVCETEAGKQLKIGSGLTDDLRRNPPEKGVVITYKYYGVTKKGNPRFPVFLRVRVDSAFN